MNFFSHACHQIPQRSFFIGKYQFPICTRCTGLYIGYITGLFTYIKYKKMFSFKYSMACITIMAIDGLGQLLKFFESTNKRRFITGFLAGVSIIGLIIKKIKKIKK